MSIVSTPQAWRGIFTDLPKEEVSLPISPSAPKPDAETVKTGVLKRYESPRIPLGLSPPPCTLHAALDVEWTLKA